MSENKTVVQGRFFTEKEMKQCQKENKLLLQLVAAVLFVADHLSQIPFILPTNGYPLGIGE